MTINLADPQWIAVIITLVLALIGGTFTITTILIQRKHHDKESQSSKITQKQKAGNKSKNYQAGRDINNK